MSNAVPVHVSPLIRLARWTMLIMGINYGVERRSILSESETKRRAEEERARPARERKIAEEKRKMNSDEQIKIAAAAGIELGVDFKG